MNGDGDGSYGIQRLTQHGSGNTCTEDRLLSFIDYWNMAKGVIDDQRRTASDHEEEDSPWFFKILRVKQALINHYRNGPAV